MPESDSERFRREAEECRQMAARAANPHDRVAWLKLAADWLSLAEVRNPEHEMPAELVPVVRVLTRR
jgi:hypothetical protein